MAMTKAKQAEIAEAIAQLREWIKPGDTVYTILESTSRSGMSRQIRTVIPYIREQCDTCGAPAYPDREIGDHYTRPDGWRSRQGAACSHVEACGGIITSRIDHIHPNHSIGLVTGYKRAKRGSGDGLIVGGCGMDMGYHLVYALARKLWPDGFDCIGPGCPSNDHSNGDRDYTPGHRHHADGGYCLKHRWL